MWSCSTGPGDTGLRTRTGSRLRSALFSGDRHVSGHDPVCPRMSLLVSTPFVLLMASERERTVTGRVQHTLRTLLFVTVFVVAVAFIAQPAAAQNTINQTACGGVTGVGTCLTSGFLQDLTVSCGAGFPANQVSTVLAQITDRNGPNRITLSGSGCGGVGIVGFNRLTIVGDGSPVGGFWSI